MVLFLYRTRDLPLAVKSFRKDSEIAFSNFMLSFSCGDGSFTLEERALFFFIIMIVKLRDSFLSNIPVGYTKFSKLHGGGPAHQYNRTAYIVRFAHFKILSHSNLTLSLG